MIKNRFFRHIFLLLTVISLSFGMTSCRDDYFDSFYGDGSDFVTLELDYAPYADTPLQTRAATLWAFPGGGIGDIKDLCMVLFDEEDNFVKLVDLGAEPFTETDVERTDADASNGQLAGETLTKRRTYRLEMEAGRYYAYAVANLGTYNSDGTVVKTTKQYLQEQGISSMSRGQFRKIRKVWDASNYRNNSEMTGIFTLGARNGSEAYTGMEEPTVYLRPGITAHCWLRRMVSKVTVDFDASHLSGSTTIYLKEIRLRDIPYDCSLIEKNAAAHSSLGSPTAPENSAGGLIHADSHGIRLCGDAYADDGQAETQHVNWPYLTAGIPTLKALAESFDATTPAALTARKETLLGINHSNSANCLFFYENMHGRDETKPKHADADLDGVIDSPDSYLSTDPDYKDRVPGGTYVEVIAYYHSLEPGNEGEGNIIYRFMLGQDTDFDYNAERNHHYKLTLCFKGYANDVDWHIEYDREKPPYSMPDEYFISYGYNEMTEFPITISGELVNGVIQAEIVRNDWYPYQMWQDAVAANGGTNSNSAYVSYFNGTVTKPNSLDTKSVALGFLSLRKPQKNVIGESYTAPNGVSYLWKVWQGEEDAADHPRTSKRSLTALYQTKYFDTQYDYDKCYKEKRSLGFRVYSIPAADLEAVGTGDKPYGAETRTEYADTEDGGYRVHTIKPASSIQPRQTTFYIPLYTREKNLAKATGYTGENPYDSYQRRAKVRFSFQVKDKKGNIHNCVKTIPIIQVAKIANPLAIWRDWNSAAPFHVVLKYPIANTNNFADLTSHEGGWSAEVEHGSEWILLNGGKRKVFGDKGSTIEFDIRPAGILQNSSQVRCGVITVRYHNYSCIHKIFVRQGYDPLQIISGGPKWHTGNLITATKESRDPCDEGSLFRAGNLTQPIAASANVTDKASWLKVTPAFWADHADQALPIAGKTATKKFSEITSSANYKALGFPTDVTLGSGTTATTHKMMTVKHISDMRDHADVKYQFGVMYNQNATETLSTIPQAYGYKSGDASKKTYGMRGCIVYNVTDGRQIFFPIGSSGYGKRKNKGTTTYAQSGTNKVPAYLGWVNGRVEMGDAVVRYSTSRITFMSTTDAATRPLLWDIFRSYGANYWTRAAADTDPNFTGEDSFRTALDLNYSTFDFNTIGSELFQGADGKSDACFIRLIN